MFYHHYKDVPAEDWTWEHFTPAEIASKGDGSILIVPEALDRLEALRVRLDKPLVILSAYRDPLHNARVGGAPLSQHKNGVAFDIRLDFERNELLIHARAVGFTGYGIYKTFTHIDCGPARSWHGSY